MKKNIEPEYKNEVKSSPSTVLHQRKRSKESLSDEYETPIELFQTLCGEYALIPQLDVCADNSNTKSYYYIPKRLDGLNSEWVIDPFKCDWRRDLSLYSGSKKRKTDVWCNPPHSKNEQFVRKAFEQWQKHNINIMMLLPCNTQSSKYWHECIEKKAEYHPIKGRIRFLVDGKPSKHLSRNAYCVVIWRKK